MKKILLTGSCGFIYSNFIRKAIKDHWQYEIVGVDKLVMPYNRKSILSDSKLYIGDIADNNFMENVFAIEGPDIVLHTAAESFVDDSIKSAQPFVRSNVLGTQVMIDMALKYKCERFVYTSTDEVMGQILPGDRPWVETDRPGARNPYSASKLAGEVLVYAAHETHGLPYNITRSSNCYGGTQPFRNLVPRTITNLLNNKPVPIHGKGFQMREWLYVEDACDAVMTIIDKAPLNEIYNIGSGFHLRNIDMVKFIGRYLNIDNPSITYIPDRLGHDQSYYVNCEKLKRLGWEQKHDFDTGMKKTIEWYLANQSFYDI